MAAVAAVPPAPAAPAACLLHAGDATPGGECLIRSGINLHALAVTHFLPCMVPVQGWLHFQQHQHYEQEMQRQKVSVSSVLISVCMRWL